MNKQLLSSAISDASIRLANHHKPFGFQGEPLIVNPEITLDFGRLCDFYLTSGEKYHLFFLTFPCWHFHFRFQLPNY